ncbi:hypothetical protein V492_08081 [Pseudogymnoascus sp. VKM F-4246]|nr:hypothetical protein V492_08081 [Pseudogymnoascus sp. VKM F-4246]
MTSYRLQCIQNRKGGARSSRKYAAEWRAIAQVLDQILHTAQVSAHKRLLLNRAPRNFRSWLPPFHLATEGTGEFARAALEHGGHRVAGAGGGNAG